MYIKDAQEYRKEVAAIIRELGTLPEGSLIKKRSFYYEKTGDVQRGITKDPERVRQLVRKSFLKYKLRHLKGNLKIAEIQSQRYRTEDTLEIIQMMPPFFMDFPVNYFYPSSMKGKQESQNTYHAEELIYLTESGLRVRSKSERSIANALERNKLLFYYEAPLYLDGITKYPDFTVYRLSDNKVILWEHFGRMDLDEYRQSTVRKLHFYEQHGFFPCDNLICTYENDLTNLAKIQSIIKTYFL